MVDTKNAQDDAGEKYKDDNAKKKEAKAKIEEQGKRTGQLHSEATANDVKLLDETYEEKYGELISAHKATKNYLKANGKTIAMYKRDMAVLKEQMKFAEVLGLDDEWQKKQVQKIKDDNQKRVDDLEEKKSKAQNDAAAADDEKDAVEAIEKAVPEFKKIQGSMLAIEKAAGAIFYTEAEYAKATGAKETEKTEESVNEADDEKKEEKKFIKNFSKLTLDKGLTKEIGELTTPEDKKARIKKALESFRNGHEDYIAAQIANAEIKIKVGTAIENMGEDERPKGSGKMQEWKDIEITKFETSKLKDEIEEKIKMTDDAESDPSDILKIEAVKNPEIEQLENDVKDLQSKKDQYKEEIKKLQGEKDPEEDDKVVEIKKLKGDIDTFKAEKSKLQNQIKELQAA